MADDWLNEPPAALRWLLPPWAATRPGGQQPERSKGASSPLLHKGRAADGRPHHAHPLALPLAKAGRAARSTARRARSPCFGP